MVTGDELGNGECSEGLKRCRRGLAIPPRDRTRRRHLVAGGTRRDASLENPGLLQRRAHAVGKEELQLGRSGEKAEPAAAREREDLSRGGVPDQDHRVTDAVPAELGLAGGRTARDRRGLAGEGGGDRGAAPGPGMTGGRGEPLVESRVEGNDE